VDKLDTL